MRELFAANRLACILALALLLSLLFTVRSCSPAGDSARELGAMRLSLALRDTLRVERLASGALRYQKESLQATTTELQAHLSELTAQQQRLLAQVAEAQKNQKRTGQTLLLAGSVASHTRLKSSLPAVIAKTDTTGGAIWFDYKSDSISYSAQLTGARAKDASKFPRLRLESLDIPNEATIDFQWDEHRPGIPVSFSVINSNPLVNVTGLESYAIPDLRPEMLQPHGWAKVLYIAKTALKYGVPVFVAGAVVGFVAPH